jgi:hypothetical protein
MLLASFTGNRGKYLRDRERCSSPGVCGSTSGARTNAYVLYARQTEGIVPCESDKLRQFALGGTRNAWEDHKGKEKKKKKEECLSCYDCSSLGGKGSA